MQAHFPAATSRSAPFPRRAKPSRRNRTEDLPAAQAALVLEQREALAQLGLVVEDFGGGTVLLAGFSALLGRRPPREVFQPVVDQLLAKERVPSKEQLL